MKRHNYLLCEFTVVLLGAALLILLSSCKPEDNPTEPTHPDNINEQYGAHKGVVFLHPTGSLIYREYGTKDTVRWWIHPDSSVQQVVVEIKKSQVDADWKHFFYEDAGKGNHEITYDMNPRFAYRMRIRNHNGGVWDTSATITLKNFDFFLPTDRISEGMLIKIKYINSYGNKVIFEYKRNVNDANWMTIIPPGAPPFLYATSEMVSTDPHLLRMRDVITNMVSTKSFYVTKGPHKRFTILAPLGNDRYVNGEQIRIEYLAYFDPVAFDFSSDNGFNWREIQTPTEPTLPSGRVYWIAHIERPSSFCRIRMRTSDTCIAVMSDIFEIDTAAVRYRILQPRAGEVVFPGTNFDIIYESDITGAQLFSVSTDNGANWIDLGAHEGGKFNWFISQNPSTQTRLRMKSGDGKHTFITEKFSIDDHLADFLPLRVGLEIEYLRTKTIARPQSGWVRTDTVKFRTIKVTSINETSDKRLYQCEITDRDKNGNKIDGFFGTIEEELSGYHRISAPFPPFNWSSFNRFYSVRVKKINITLINRSRTSEDPTWERKGVTVEAGKGVTSAYHSWQSTPRLYDYDSYLWGQIRFE